MSYTTDIQLTGDSFSLVAEGDCFAQLKTGGPVLVAVAASQPANGYREGVVLYEEGLQAVSITGTESGDNVYAISLQAESNTLGVIAAGTAPA